MDRLRELLATDTGVLEETVTAARDRSPQVAALPLDEVRRHVLAMIRAAMLALGRGDLAEPDLAAAERLGADRARQGVPVAALLDGFQAGRTHLVRSVVERGRAAGMSADELLDAVTRIDEIATALEHRMVHAHRITELDRAMTVRESTAHRLRALLHGEPVAEDLPSGRAWRCVVSRTGDPVAVRPVEAALAAAGLAAVVDGRLVAVVGRLPEPAPGGPLLVVSPPVPADRLPEVYPLCRTAADAAEGLSGPYDLAALALLAATAARPALGELLAGTLLPGLDRRDPFHRDLADTALAYLDHAGRVEPTAAALHVHPNTVKYRLRRFQEVTGTAPSGPVTHTAHCWWALRSWSAAD